MKALSYCSLFISSLFASRFLAISQIGTDWEIPSELITDGVRLLGYSSIFLILSLIILFIPKCRFLEMRNMGKFIFLLWEVVVLIIIVLGSNKFIYQLPCKSMQISNIIKNSFYPGVITSVILFSLLMLMNKRRD